MRLVPIHRARREAPTSGPSGLARGSRSLLVSFSANVLLVLLHLRREQLVCAMPDGQLLTVAQLAERLGVSKRWVRERLRPDALDPLPFVRLSERQIRFDPEQIDLWVGAHADPRCGTLTPPMR